MGQIRWVGREFFFSGVGLWVLRPLTGLLYQPRMIGDGDCGEIGGMKIGRGNRKTRRKPAPAALCPPQIPHDQNRVWTRAAAVGSQRLRPSISERHSEDCQFPVRNGRLLRSSIVLKKQDSFRKRKTYQHPYVVCVKHLSGCMFIIIII
jgi:hypothetical protein